MGVTGDPALNTTLRPTSFTPLFEAQSLGQLGALYDQPVKGPGASLRLFSVPEKSDRGPSPSLSGACRAGMNPAGFTGASDMFNDIWIARKSALSLARNLMVVTMVIAVGTQFSVITAEDHDSSLTVIHDYDPFEIM